MYTDPYDYREQRRQAQRKYREERRQAQREYREQRRRYERYQNPLRGLSGVVVVVAIIVGITMGGNPGWPGFLSILFMGLAFSSLLGSLSSLQRNAILGGLQGFIWLMGLALCFWIGFWPWILIPVAASIILGPLQGALMYQSTREAGPLSMIPSEEVVEASNSPVHEERAHYQPYQEGYRGAAPTLERDEKPVASPANFEQYEQPQVAYPEQELPPMEQH